jgi:hypothetical protein
MSRVHYIRGGFLRNCLFDMADMRHGSQCSPRGSAHTMRSYYRADLFETTLRAIFGVGGQAASTNQKGWKQNTYLMRLLPPPLRW